MCMGAPAHFEQKTVRERVAGPVSKMWRARTGTLRPKSHDAVWVCPPPPCLRRLLVFVLHQLHAIASRLQGLTLVHFTAQLEPCLTKENTLHTLNTP